MIFFRPPGGWKQDVNVPVWSPFYDLGATYTIIKSHTAHPKNPGFEKLEGFRYTFGVLNFEKRITTYLGTMQLILRYQDKTHRIIYMSI